VPTSWRRRWEYTPARPTARRWASTFPRRAARPGEVAAKAGQTFEVALERIKPVAGTIIAKLRGLSDPPDEAVVEFGLKMSGQAGSVVVASVGAEAHYKVTLTWRREEKKEEKKKSKPSTGR
jgi:hypothetical protein